MNDTTTLQITVKFHRGAWTAKLADKHGLPLFGRGLTKWSALGVLFANIDLAEQDGEIEITQNHIEIQIQGRRKKGE